MSKYTKSARGQECLVRSPVCNGDPATVVFAHLNGAGMGKKASDIHGAYCCSACHAWLDGGYVKGYSRAQRDLWHLEAVIRTQRKMIDDGVLRL